MVHLRLVCILPSALKNHQPPYIHAEVPDELRGRVMSIYMLDNGIMPVATLLLGLLIHVWSPTAAFTLFGSLALGATLMMALGFKQVRRLD